MRLIWGGIGQPFSPPPFLSGFMIWGPILITRYRLAVLFTTAAVLIGLWAFLHLHASSAASCAPVRAIPRWSACSASTCRAC